MRKTFIDILENYQIAKSDQNIRQDVRGMFKAIVSEFADMRLVQQYRNIKVKSGIGIGSIALVPWVSFLDKRETTTTQKGEYVIFLFKGDMSGFYLTFNQGVGISDKGDRVSRAPTSADFRRVHSKAVEIRRKVPELMSMGFSLDDNIDLAVRWGAGKAYEQSTIAYKFYERKSLPSEGVLLEDLEKVLSVYNQYIENKLQKKEVVITIPAKSDPSINYWLLAYPRTNMDITLKTSLIGGKQNPSYERLFKSGMNTGDKIVLYISGDYHSDFSYKIKGHATVGKYSFDKAIIWPPRNGEIWPHRREISVEHIMITLKNQIFKTFI